MSLILDAYQSIQNMSVANKGTGTTAQPTTAGFGGSVNQAGYGESYGTDDSPYGGDTGKTETKALSGVVQNNSLNAQGNTTQDYIKFGASVANTGSALLQAFGKSELAGYLGVGANVANLGVSGYNVATGQAHGTDYTALGSASARTAGNYAMQQGSQNAITGVNLAGAGLAEGANYAKFGYDVYKVIDEGPQEGRGANAVTSGVGAGVGTAAGMGAGAAAGGASAAVRTAYLIGNNIMQTHSPTSPTYTAGNVLSTPFTFALDVGGVNAITQASGSKMPTAQFTALPRQFEQTAYKSVENALSGQISDSLRDWRDFAYDSTIGNVEDTYHYIKEEPEKAILSAATGGVSDIVLGLGNVMGFGGGPTESQIRDQQARDYAQALQDYYKSNSNYTYTSENSPFQYTKYFFGLDDTKINNMIQSGTFSDYIGKAIQDQQNFAVDFYQSMNKELYI